MTARKLGISAAAALAGVRPSTWRSYMTRGHVPDPDGREEISGAPWWYESTVAGWKRSRPGRGARTDLTR